MISSEPPSQPFDSLRRRLRSFWPILLPAASSLALGRDSPGNPEVATTFSQHLLVDYTRIYTGASPSAAIAPGPSR